MGLYGVIWGYIWVIYGLDGLYRAATCAIIIDCGRACMLAKLSKRPI